MFSEDKFSIVLLVDMVTWSLTQCGQRQLPPSMLCSLLCPPGIVSIENAIYLYISVYLILPTALMESIAGCLPILATAHGLSLPHAICKAVNPWSSCTICSSSCVFVHTCAFWQNFAQTSGCRILPVNLDQARDEEERSKPQHYASLLPSINI